MVKYFKPKNGKFNVQENGKNATTTMSPMSVLEINIHKREGRMISTFSGVVFKVPNETFKMSPTQMKNFLATATEVSKPKILR